MMRLAVFAGKFDPITNKHIAFARKLLTDQFDHIYFLPVDPAFVKPEWRHRMCEAALGSLEDMSVIGEDVSTPRKEMLSAVKTIAAVHPEHQLAFIMEDGLKAPKGYPVIPFESDSREAVLEIARYRDTSLIDRNVLAFIASQGLYQHCEEKKLREMLSKGRLQHTMGVRSTAVQLARRFDSPMIKCGVAALYHDCAKEMPVKEMRRICVNELGRKEQDEILSSGALMHGHVGAYLTEKLFNVHDEEILNAIRYHTTGRVDMSDTEMIVFLADAIEPNRADYPGLQEIRQLSEESVRAAVLLSLCVTKAYVIKSGKEFHASGDQTITWLREKCTERERSLTKQMLDKLI